MDDYVIVRRFRHLVTSSGVLPKSVRDEDLFAMAKGATRADKIRSMAAVVALTPELFWRQHDL
jgi:hypothetical protein